MKCTVDLDASLASLDLPPAIRGWLAHQGITTCRHLVDMTADDLLALPYSGGRHGDHKVAQIQAALLAVGLSLRSAES